jgi:hypothetical protein
MISRNLDIHCPELNGGPVHQPFHFPSAPLPLPPLLSLGTGVPAAHGILDKPPASRVCLNLGALGSEGMLVR